MKIKVLKTHPHGGRYRRQGDVYDCPDRKARIMIQIGKAEEYIPPPPKPVRKKAPVKKVTPKPAEPMEDPAKYQTKVMTPED